MNRGHDGMEPGGMDVELFTDLIKDERGNYYTAVHRNDNELTLVNALVERSYRVVLEFSPDFRNKHAEYEHQFIGKMATDELRHDIVFAQQQNGNGRMFDLEEVTSVYKVTFIDTIQFYRHPRTARL